MPLNSLDVNLYILASFIMRRSMQISSCIHWITPAQILSQSVKCS